MNDINFSGLDFSDSAEIKRIAQLHHEAPLDWIPNYQVDKDGIEQTCQILSESGSNLKTHIIVARDNDGQLVGFHWVSILPNNAYSGRIESLWVDEQHRRQGIASELKRLGEAWMKENGVTTVTTTVFYVNSKMINLNIKEGFKPGQLQMTKELS